MATDKKSQETPKPMAAERSEEIVAERLGQDLCYLEGLCQGILASDPQGREALRPESIVRQIANLRKYVDSGEAAATAALLGLTMGLRWGSLSASPLFEAVKRQSKPRAGKEGESERRKEESEAKRARARELFDAVPEEKRHGRLTLIYKQIARQLAEEFEAPVKPDTVRKTYLG